MNHLPAGHGAPSSPDGRHSAGRGAALRLATLLLATLVALLAVVIGASAPASAAPAPTSRVTFGIEPASATAPDGRANFNFEMTPGAVLFDHVAIVNYSATPLTLQLYATDALETSTGGFGLLQPGVTPTGVGAWITIPATASTVQVPAERATGPGYVIVPMTVRAPVKVTPGDHVGGIIASLRTVGTNATGQTVVLNQRIGSRVYVRVAGQLAPQLALSNPRASYSGSSNPIGTGKVKVTYVVSNLGNVDLAVHDQQVSVSGLLDDTHTARLANIQLLLPGTSVTQSVVIGGVWPQFRLHQTVSAQPVVLSGSAGGLSPVSASSTLWAVPWLLLLVVLVIVVVAVAWVRRRRRLRNAPAATSGVGSDPVPDDAVKAEVPA